MSVTILVKSYDIETTTELNLSDKGLTELPTEICNLTNLRYLDLANNELSELPIELGNLTNLQKLNLASNFLIVL